VKSSPTVAGLAVRPYRQEDEAEVIDLLTSALGGGPAGERTPEFFRWKHLANPFGPSLLLVGEAEGRIVGLRAFLRWRFQAGSRELRAVRAVDTATHPEFQGRGVFSELTTTALGILADQADLVFNTPNEKSVGGYLKMGWHAVGAVPVSIRVRRPLRFALGMTGHGRARGRPDVEAEPADRSLADGDAVARLIRDAGDGDTRLRTPIDVPFLRWRYGSAPLLDYRAVREMRGGELRGLAVFRVGRRGPLWEARVSEVIVPRGDAATARRLLRRVARAGSFDHLTASFPAGSIARRAARGTGFLRAPQGPRLVVNPIRDSLDPDPTAMTSWALSLGDLEVF
jgi:GNAT superfamily N-acetyltransferase